jgi:hypothetical protein
MTPADKQQITAFMANPALVEAVKRVLVPESETLDDIDDTLDDEQYGRRVRVFKEVRKLVAARFATLTRIGSSNPQPAQQNEAR